MKKIPLTLILATALCATHIDAKTVKYNFDINTKIVNFTGTDIKTIAVNNQIPAPKIEATVGDTLEVTFHNKLDEETSIHWHGVLLPNDQDGVPHLTTPPMQPGTSFTYKYKITHSGTYWYHSHTGLQEQSGIYGSLVFHPKNGERIKAKHDHVVILSEWNDEHPDDVLANLKKDGDWYALKKGTVQSWDKVIENGSQAILNRLDGSMTRMGPMDLSDIGYDKFLSNGHNESTIKAKAGDTVRLRLINAGASSYFNVEFAGAPMAIVATDGVDIDPISVKRLRIASAETYDVIVKIPKNKAYELRSTATDGTGYSSVFIGNGKKVLAPDIPRPNLFVIDHSMHGTNGKMDHSKHEMSGMKMPDMEMPKSMPAMKHDMGAMPEKMDHSQHDMSDMKMPKSMPAMKHDMGAMPEKMEPKKEEEPSLDNLPYVEYLTDYKAFKSLSDTTLPKNNTNKVVELALTGNMERYVWSFNEKTLLESERILIQKGENVKFILKNDTMMNHPIHLHGHFFRVLNGQGKMSPLKHTVNVPSMETVEIEFEANEEKDWFFHCHNLYHAKNGMARFISYAGSTQATDETFEMLGKDKWYHLADMSFLSHIAKGNLRLSNTRNAIEMEYDSNYKKAYDVDLIYARSFTRFFDAYIGGSFERKGKKHKPDNKGIIGVRYMLPLLIESDLRLNTNGKWRLGLGSQLQLTERNQFEWHWNTNKEYYLGLSYEITKNILLSVSYDSDFKWGAGLRVKF